MHRHNREIKTMKPIAQLSWCVAAAALLLHAATAQATNLSELPLKSSIYIKPNVIFGYDDSGSMLFEMLVKGTENGRLQWDTSAGTGWDIAGNPLTEKSTKYAELFPQTSTTDAYETMNTTWQGVPPTAQFASLRAAQYQSLYFDPNASYAPWSPAYVSSLEKTYPNISIANALASTPSVLAPFDPRSTGTKIDLMAERWWMANGQKGMVVPVGGKYYDGGWIPVSGAPYTLPGNRYMQVKYYPATYWMRVGSTNKGVTVADCTVNNVDCTFMPRSNTVKLRRFEIKKDNYPNEDAFKAEIQNFANWFSYYRKRYLMTNAAMGKVMEGLTGMRVGVVRFNAQANVTMYDLDSSDPSKNGKRVTGIFYGITPNGGTPTISTLDYIGRQYTRTDTPIIQYSCQRNNAFIVTDGFYNGSRPTRPSYDGTKWGSNVPQKSTDNDTLADFALGYYTRNPRPDLPLGKVPSGKAGANQDVNNNLHVNTYALALNLQGEVWTGNDMPLPTTDIWSALNPTNDQPSAIDDLWHATINGRGKMYLATDPASTAAKISEGLRDIAAQVGAQGAIGVGSINLDRAKADNTAYLASFDPSGWGGDLVARKLSADTGAVAEHKWGTNDVNGGVASKLAARTPASRIIVADTAAGPKNFDTAGVGAIVNPDTADFPDNAKVVDYLRGVRTGEGDTFRPRTSLLGAAINAEPVVDPGAKVVYLATGEGMLHAFDTDNGAELWAFVPREVLGTAGNSPIGQTVERAYSFKTKLDATPVIATLGTQKLLVSGLGAAGRSYFALDVTNARPGSAASLAAMVKWNFTDTRMGYTVGQPVVVSTKDHGDVVLVTSGYDNGDPAVANGGRGWMWMLNASTGAVIKRFSTDAASTGEAGLAHVSGYLESNGKVRYVYAGDLTGTVWRFDLDAAGSDLAGTMVARLKDASGNAQPVTTAPELYQIGDKRVVLVGTGRLLDTSDFGSTTFTNSFYAIADKDGAPLANARTALVNKAYTRGTGSTSEAKVNSSTVNTTKVDWSTGRGWFIDLPAGEHDNTNPVVALGTVIFATNANGGSSCEQSSYLYMLDVGSGGPIVKDNWVSKELSNSLGASRALTLRVSGGRVVITNHMSDNSVKLNDGMSQSRIGATRNSWREVTN